MKRRIFTTKLLAAAGLGLALAPIQSLAKVIEKFEPKSIIGDGKDGRVSKKWTQPVRERNIHKVRVILERRSGGDNTYVNLRFGEKGEAVEKGRRVYIRTDKRVTETFIVNQTPGGQPLVLNAYNGEVYIRLVDTHDE